MSQLKVADGASKAWYHRVTSMHDCSLGGTSHHPSWCRQATRMLGVWD